MKQNDQKDRAKRLAQAGAELRNFYSVELATEKAKEEARFYKQTGLTLRLLEQKKQIADTQIEQLRERREELSARVVEVEITDNPVLLQEMKDALMRITDEEDLRQGELKKLEPEIFRLTQAMRESRRALTDLKQALAHARLRRMN